MVFKRGQAGVISVVLLILIALVSIVIIWNVVGPLIGEKSSEIDISKVTADLNIKDAVSFINGASKVTVKRNMGGGEITSLKFIFYDSKGNSYAKTEDKETIGEFETKTYSFGPMPLEEIQKVAVVPYFKKVSGRESEAAIGDVLQLPSSLAGWWRFEENSEDFAGGNNCEEAVIFNDADKGKVAKFQSVPIKCGNREALSMNDEIGLSFWVKTTEGGAIMQKGNNYKASIEDGKVVFDYKGMQRKSNLAINDGKWHHVAISMLSTYIDGNPDSILAIDGSASINTDELLIGQFNGYLNEVMIFNSSLSSGQVSAIYNLQK